MFKGIRRTAVALASVLILSVGAVIWATSAASAATTTPACSASDLSVWVDINQGSGGAGTFAYPLDFTNTSGHACTVHGYPGVSATGANGKQIGTAAAWTPLFKAKTVTIPAGGTAHAYLEWVQVADFTPSACKPASATELKVYPPNQKSATYGFFDLEGCTNTNPFYDYLRVTTIQPGVGLVL